MFSTKRWILLLGWRGWWSMRWFPDIQVKMPGREQERCHKGGIMRALEEEWNCTITVSEQQNMKGHPNCYSIPHNQSDEGNWCLVLPSTVQK